METMRNLIKEVPNLIHTIEKDIEKNGAYYCIMYGSYQSNTLRIDEKYKNAIKGWCKEYGYKFEDLHDFYHTYKITEIT